MQAPQDVARGAGMVVLHEIHRPAHGGVEYLLPIGFHEKSPLVAEHGRFDEQYIGDLQWCHLHSTTRQETDQDTYCLATQSRYAPLVTSATHCGLSIYHCTVLRIPDSNVSAGFQPSSCASLVASMA